MKIQYINNPATKNLDYTKRNLVTKLSHRGLSVMGLFEQMQLKKNWHLQGEWSDKFVLCPCKQDYDIFVVY